MTTDWGRKQRPPGGERHNDDQDGIADGRVAKQQSTKKMVLVMIARGGGTCVEGGLHDDNMSTAMTVHHTTIWYRKEGRKRRL